MTSFKAAVRWVAIAVGAALVVLAVAAGAGSRTETLRRLIVETLSERLGSDVELLVGPEGGFDAAELAAAKLAGLRAVALGPRVLKAETACVAAIAALQALRGDLMAPG